MSIELGKFNQLEVVKEVSAGWTVCLSGSLLGKSIRSFPELGIDERPVCAVP